jgi:hypothetical protein
VGAMARDHRFRPIDARKSQAAAFLALVLPS